MRPGRGILRIRHRVNTISLLERVPSHYGIEVDLRSDGPRLIAHHDAFCAGEPFREILNRYRHAFLIVNIKCEGIEEEVLFYLKQKRIKDFFLLDLSFPAMVKLVRKGENRLAIRCSEFEPVEACELFRGKIQWAWADCFKGKPLGASIYTRLKRSFRVCAVSPELQGYSEDKIPQMRKVLYRRPLDAVCTKFPELW